MINKKIFIVLIVIILILAIFFGFFYKKTVKVFKSGNNKTSQEIVDYILGISSYEVKVTVEVNSNKNSNKYILKQQYVSPNINTQEVIEPSNIAGIKLINDGTSLTLKNSKLGLNTVFENYTYLGDNCIDLISFIEDYKKSNESNYEENDTEIIMKTLSQNLNKYTKYKKLYIDKKTANPTKLEIKDDNEKTTVYILYNEVKINNTNKEEVLAFDLYNVFSSI
jgi:outer membrane lipoprotein-sorting protein